MTSPLNAPFDERDACGIGFVAHRSAGPSHDIVDHGLHLLENLEHRGACGCDGETGDGAGLLLPLPDAFLRARMQRRGIDLPARGDYGVAMLFLPADEARRSACIEEIEAVLCSDGLPVLGWRQVPTRAHVLGTSAAETEPAVWQCLVRRPRRLADASTAALDRALYLARRGIEQRIAARLPDAEVHVASFSAQTIVYKGMLTAGQLRSYYPDLSARDFCSRYALAHARFSTNTLPRWELAQPFRRICHNGEINTLRGNVNRMRARESLLGDGVFQDDLDRLRPVVDTQGSDSRAVDSAVELLVHGGRSLDHALAMLVPQAWEHDDSLPRSQRAFYRYHACLMEPWDGPAAIAFGDGTQVGALLDRSGLRPARYTVLADGRFVLASEAGALDVPASQVDARGRLGPGHMIRVGLDTGRLETNAAIKHRLSRRRPYAEWLDAHLEERSVLAAPAGPAAAGGNGQSEAEKTPAGPALSGAEFGAGSGATGEAADASCLHRLHHTFGYTQEDLRLLLAPMGGKGKEAIGSMGDDTPLAVLSDRNRLLYDHFRQLFAQVTNPPLDAIREEQVTGLDVYLGAEGPLLTETPEHASRLHLDHPVLDVSECVQLQQGAADSLTPAVLDATFDADDSLSDGLRRLCTAAHEAIDDAASLLLLSDRRTLGPEADRRLPIPMLLAVGAVHHALVRDGRRTRASLVADSGEPREVHHLAALLGYGADAVCPYGGLATIRRLAETKHLAATPAEAKARYVSALCNGVLKVMSKMGISTLQGYSGAQIFEIVGLADAVVDTHFCGTVSRLGGVGLDVLEERVRSQHRRAVDAVRRRDGAAPDAGLDADLDVGGRYQWREDGEQHALTPSSIASLQHATRSDEPREQKYREYAQEINAYNRDSGTLRGLLRLLDANGQALPLEEVEPWTDIVTRFKTGAMSYGSISSETHQTLARAMNELGGKSNTGEGGEHPDRYADDHPARSRIKQIASGRFGVTLPYLDAADEIQIKMAQGAKPGEGGQLPGEKVYPWIAEVRHSTPGVPLISPPPHHDIYSIEDLAQLIFDLKNANPDARISVKLVSAAGVGTIAAGVAKAKADHILISGHSGGTGASPQGSIMHAGLPWECGIAEAHQMLVRQGLRNRVTLEADGGLRTGRDVAVAALLGAQEFGFSTAPLISLGCIMMRKCHLNTCPVGIATQDPELRDKFDGRPDHVINFFYLVAQEVRRLLARLGMRSVEEMVGRVDRLQPAPAASERGLELASLLRRPTVPPALRAEAARTEQDHAVDDVLDHALIEDAAPALRDQTPVRLDVPITNQDRTVGTRLSRAVIRRHGRDGLPDDTIRLRCRGTAGQSFAAFAAPGLTFDVYGQANDYLGKGLSGARITLQPPDEAAYRAEDAVVAGNVALYGATSGQLFLRGRAGERFAVRNSGAEAVVEGIGDHGCEYMTGGCVVVLGPIGTNFAAGMSGGVAYVWNRDGSFRRRLCNRDMVELESVSRGTDDARRLRSLVEQHHAATASPVAARFLQRWPQVLEETVKVIATAYKEAIKNEAVQKEKREDEEAAATV